MVTGGKSRRAFLAQSASGLGAAWFAANFKAIAAAQEFVRTAAASGQAAAFAFFTPEQAVEVEAMAAEGLRLFAAVHVFRLRPPGARP